VCCTSSARRIGVRFRFLGWLRRRPLLRRGLALRLLRRGGLLRGRGFDFGGGRDLIGLVGPTLRRRGRLRAIRLATILPRLHRLVLPAAVLLFFGSLLRSRCAG